MPSLSAVKFWFDSLDGNACLSSSSQESLWDFAMQELWDLRQLYILNRVGSVLLLLLLLVWTVNLVGSRGRDVCKRREERVIEESWLISLVSVCVRVRESGDGGWRSERRCR